LPESPFGAEKGDSSIISATALAAHGSLRHDGTIFGQHKLLLARHMSRLGAETAFDVLNKSRALERQGKSIIHLEIGEPDFDTPANVVEAAVNALHNGWTHYSPSAGLPELRQAIADEVKRTRGVKVSQDEVVVEPGGNLHTLKPIDAEAVVRAARETDVVVTAEEHQIGALAWRVSSILTESRQLYGLPLITGAIGVKDRFGDSGAPWELIKELEVSAEHIAHKVVELMAFKNMTRPAPVLQCKSTLPTVSGDPERNSIGHSVP
jgi:hypothetical protein